MVKLLTLTRSHSVLILAMSIIIIYTFYLWKDALCRKDAFTLQYNPWNTWTNDILYGLVGTWDQLEPILTNQEPFEPIQVDSDQSQQRLTMCLTNLDKWQLIWFNLDHSGQILTNQDWKFNCDLIGLDYSISVKLGRRVIHIC